MVAAPWAMRSRKNLPQARRCHGPAEISPGNSMVLAVNTAQIAAGKEHRSGAAVAAEHRLLPGMQSRPGHYRGSGHAAEAVPLRFCSFSPAAAGTNTADHPFKGLKSGPRSPATQWRRQRPMYLSLAPSTTCSPSLTTWPCSSNRALKAAFCRTSRWFLPPPAYPPEPGAGSCRGKAPPLKSAFRP